MENPAARDGSSSPAEEDPQACHAANMIILLLWDHAQILSTFMKQRT
jgi:hypothetical protein